ncbi:hypothetical protein CLIM01_01066 [Colletotrichum limetticola]|uniref:Uncharacterized protein n=1 Tax=Colletotrichum limetticola TaxID=1209924 RepID=A0ABQ9QCP6_9PEZI|nr:hypothetical protein CLIM01_01066 [Colletotrichum limetticola]
MVIGRPSFLTQRKRRRPKGDCQRSTVCLSQVVGNFSDEHWLEWRCAPPPPSPACLSQRQWEDEQVSQGTYPGQGIGKVMPRTLPVGIGHALSIRPSLTSHLSLD